METYLEYEIKYWCVVFEVDVDEVNFLLLVLLPLPTECVFEEVGV